MFNVSSRIVSVFSIYASRGHRRGLSLRGLSLRGLPGPCNRFSASWYCRRPQAVPGRGPHFPALLSYVSVQSRGGHRHLQIGRCMYVCIQSVGTLVARRGRKRFIASWCQDVTYLSLHPMPPPPPRSKGRKVEGVNLPTSAVHPPPPHPRSPAATLDEFGYRQRMPKIWQFIGDTKRIRSTKYDFNHPLSILSLIWLVSTQIKSAVERSMLYF